MGKIEIHTLFVISRNVICAILVVIRVSSRFTHQTRRQCRIAFWLVFKENSLLVTV
jgi:hypothetical protein